MIWSLGSWKGCLRAFELSDTWACLLEKLLHTLAKDVCIYLHGLHLTLSLHTLIINSCAPSESSFTASLIREVIMHSH
jgi:hypothetical protein